jgi:hypothetical protein
VFLAPFTPATLAHNPRQVTISIWDRAQQIVAVPALPAGPDTAPVIYDIDDLAARAAALGWTDFWVDPARRGG